METTGLRDNSENGFSFVELLVSVAIMTVILGAVVGVLQRGQMVFNNERNVLDSVQNMRAAFDMITREITMAGSGQIKGYGIVSGAGDSITIRGNFQNVSTIALSVSPTTGAIVVGSTGGFRAGQTVALTDPNNGTSLWATVTSVDAATKTLVVSASTTPITSGAMLSMLGPGAMVDVIQRVRYSIADNGTITRTESPELDTNDALDSVLAENVLDANGAPGLSFDFYDSNGASISAPLTSVAASNVSLVTVNLNVRTKERDVQTGSYRNFSLSTDVRPRNQ